MTFILDGEKLIAKTWTDGVQFEEEAKRQILNIGRLPFIHKWISVMPDVHSGKGATVGSVIPTVDVIIPAAVGVDIGCGMMAVKTDLNASDLPDNLSELRSNIEKRVPHGRTDNGGRNDRGAFGSLPKSHEDRWNYELKADFEEIVKDHKKLSGGNNWNHLGTLGTGNHFIEICLDTDDVVWVMLHSGSRGIGNKIGSYFIEIAKKEMERWYINLPDKDLAYLPAGSQYFGDYWKALSWAQRYASINRELMMGEVLKALKDVTRDFSSDLEIINCHHNYVSSEYHFGKKVFVTRKGAIRAGKDEYGIIPGSMGARSYIVKGLGNKDSFESCSHGAGRAMSRTEARKRFTIEDHIRDTSGVECRKDTDVIDETPAAYKSIDSVMEAQKDLVEPIHTLKQILCVKG